MNLSVLGMGRTVKPEEYKHYDFKGAMVALCIDREYYQLVTTMMLMFRDTSSFTIFLDNEKNYLILDVPYGCTGISRTGMLTGPQELPEWFYNISQFKLESNKINYLGRFSFFQDEYLNPVNDTLAVSNAFEKDREWFLEYYPPISNKEWAIVPVRYGKFKPDSIPNN
jgi:hypothetical protein